MDFVKSALSPFVGSSSSLQDTLKLVVIGGTVETARRASVSAWSGFVDSFFLTAHFSQEDYPYDWLMHWLSKQPAWGRSREFEITTRAISRNGMTQSTTGDLEEEEEELEDEEEDELVHGRRKRKVAFMPSLDTTHTIYYRGHWLRITRTKKFQEYGHHCALKISVVARNNDILKKLVLEAKREYEKDAEHRVHIFMADTTYGCWRWNGARQKRPMSSIVLEPAVKEMLLADCKDFLRSEDWSVRSNSILMMQWFILPYVQTHSGKTSLIHSMAGELGLDIYVVSLSSKGMSDNTLTTLMGNVPSRCILLLEDLDAAFTRSVSRDSSSTGTPTATVKTATEANDGSTLSLSGLLNSLDGVAAAEGRLLFATTNHIERLDPALSRPGRMDVWVNFKNATKWQAEGIFKCFFPSKPSAVSSVEASPPQDNSQKNMPIPKRKQTSHAVPLLDEAEISELAKRFADSIPEDEMSVASLQGYLLKNKTRPRECVEEVAGWIIQERETRIRLKKEKEEREAKEKKEAEEQARKEKEELAAKEKEQELLKEKLEKKEARKRAKKAARPDGPPPVNTEIIAMPPPPPPPTSTSGATPSTPFTVEPSSPDSDSDSSSSDEDSQTEVTANEADAEESVTSEGESERPSDESASPNGDAQASEKWVAVKGLPEPSRQ
ncbi:hypothetical protein EW146_g9003 [Bondarzewia mesenterica]|uniref:BCS1 N-terminal domain-containing protein n=1 Tax=Bondarzewia mesenterica TaxID=1095465 RepID=A0A4S4LA85_9AGAM|nr:hypothetical protein EW146_g9003 [Bondarzewia mesenterica]